MICVWGHSFTEVSFWLNAQDVPKWIKRLFSFKRYPPWVHSDTNTNSKPALVIIQLSDLF